MLDLDYIKSTTIWVVKLNAGRITCTEKDLYKYNDNKDVRDIDVVCWEGQPKELQPFWKAYEYANRELHKDLFLVDDFYKEWIKNPNQFEPDHLPVITTLFKAFNDIDPYSDLIIENYDGKSLGNHHAGNFMEALETLDIDFDVVQITEKYNYPAIIIQEDNRDKLRDFEYEANARAIQHDRFMGDGKYYKN